MSRVQGRETHTSLPWHPGSCYGLPLCLHGIKCWTTWCLPRIFVRGPHVLMSGAQSKEKHTYLPWYPILQSGIPLVLPRVKGWILWWLPLVLVQRPCILISGVKYRGKYISLPWNLVSHSRVPLCLHGTKIVIFVVYQKWINNKTIFLINFKTVYEMGILRGVGLLRKTLV